uniref:Uncharacterized protein n=1 Tax=Tolypothrix bouteillei VB521301 TaxID=1479485 RepID=A0A0C1NEM0_9CYAN
MKADIVMRMKIWNLVLVAAVAATLIHAHAAGTVTKKAFGKTGQGASVDLYTLKKFGLTLQK